MRLAGNTILITGGGSGIGLGLARGFYEAGNEVIIAGRRAAMLQEIVAHHPGMIALPLDIADPESIRELAAQLAAEHPRLNVLVNNAGVMTPETPIDVAVAEATVATNLLGPIRLTAALLPRLLDQPNAAIINVSSVLAFVPFAPSPSYCATKAAVHSWTVSLRHQLRGSGVEVIEIIPPAVQTDLLRDHPGNATAMPLEAYMAETLALLRQQPTPSEIYGERAKPMMDVIDAAKFAQVFASFNG